jgi:hypothetical protein
MNSKNGTEAGEEDRFERTVKRLLATPPTRREETTFGKPRGKRVASPKRARRKSQAKKPSEHNG